MHLTINIDLTKARNTDSVVNALTDFCDSVASGMELDGAGNIDDEVGTIGFWEVTTNGTEE